MAFGGIGGGGWVVGEQGWGGGVAPTPVEADEEGGPEGGGALVGGVG